MAVILKFKKIKKLCSHYRILVDVETRTIECEQCGAIVDPFDFLYRIAKEQLDLDERKKILQLDIDKLKQETTDRLVKIEELKKEERNVKARLRRFKGQALNKES